MWISIIAFCLTGLSVFVKNIVMPNYPKSKIFFNAFSFIAFCCGLASIVSSAREENEKASKLNDSLSVINFNLKTNLLSAGKIFTKVSEVQDSSISQYLKSTSLIKEVDAKSKAQIKLIDSLNYVLHNLSSNLNSVSDRLTENHNSIHPISVSMVLKFIYSDKMIEILKGQYPIYDRSIVNDLDSNVLNNISYKWENIPLKDNLGSKFSQLADTIPIPYPQIWLALKKDLETKPMNGGSQQINRSRKWENASVDILIFGGYIWFSYKNMPLSSINIDPKTIYLSQLKGLDLMVFMNGFIDRSFVDRTSPTFDIEEFEISFGNEIEYHLAMASGSYKVNERDESIFEYRASYKDLNDSNFKIIAKKYN